MRNSIQYSREFRSTNLRESAKKFSNSPKDVAGFVNEVKKEAFWFALHFIGETFTTCNDLLRESRVRRMTWQTVRTDNKNLNTSTGCVKYEHFQGSGERQVARAGIPGGG